MSSSPSGDAPESGDIYYETMNLALHNGMMIKVGGLRNKTGYVGPTGCTGVVSVVGPPTVGQQGPDGDK